MKENVKKKKEKTKKCRPVAGETQDLIQTWCLPDNGPARQKKLTERKNYKIENEITCRIIRKSKGKGHRYLEKKAKLTIFKASWLKFRMVMCLFLTMQELIPKGWKVTKSYDDKVNHWTENMKENNTQFKMCLWSQLCLVAGRQQKITESEGYLKTPWKNNWSIENKIKK